MKFFATMEKMNKSMYEMCRKYGATFGIRLVENEYGSFIVGTVTFEDLKGSPVFWYDVLPSDEENNSYANSDFIMDFIGSIKTAIDMRFDVEEINQKCNFGFDLWHGNICDEDRLDSKMECFTGLISIYVEASKEYNAAMAK